MFWQIELKFCIWLRYTVLQIKFECRQFASIFVRVMPLLELTTLEIHSFLHSLTNWAEHLHITLFHCTTDWCWVLSIWISFCRSYDPFWNLKYWKYTVSGIFSYMLWHIELTFYRVPTVLEKSLNLGFSLKSPWKWICPWKVLEFRGPSLKFQLVVLDFLFCVFWTESLNGYSKLRVTRAIFPPKIRLASLAAVYKLNIFPVPLAHI